MGNILDLNRPHRDLDGKGANADFMLQDGQIYGWSESNYRYEQAWWLTPEGLPISTNSLVQALCKDRPFNPEWLK